MLKKYPRTLHLPWSPGRSADDKVLKDTSHFIGKDVVVSWKMDGENSTLYQDYSHARSLDSKHHGSRVWLKGFHNTIKHNIPDGWRICGETLFAKHSIHYSNLKSYFYGFSIWDGDSCLSWEDTLTWFELIGILPVTTIYQGLWDEKILRNLDIGDQEGYVVRLADSFAYKDFGKNVAKYVRQNHVQPNQERWEVCWTKNQLMEE